MKEAVLISLGGPVMYHSPDIRSYFEENGLANAPPYRRWRHAIEALQRGDIRLHAFDDSYCALTRLSERYALSLFIDTPEEFQELCLRLLQLRSYFRPELVIKSDSLHSGGKKNPDTWVEAKSFLERSGCTPVACVESSIDNVRASQSAGIGISSYLVYRQSEWANDRTLGAVDVKYVTTRTLRQMAEHLLDGTKKRQQEEYARAAAK